MLTVGINDDDTGDPIDMISLGWSFLFEIRRTPPNNTGSGYIPWYDFGTPNNNGPLISAAAGTGITIIDVGILQILIYAETFRQLSGGTYLACMTATDGTNTRQVFIGKLPVYHGGVSTVIPAASYPPFTLDKSVLV